MLKRPSTLTVCGVELSSVYVTLDIIEYHHFLIYFHQMIGNFHTHILLLNVLLAIAIIKFQIL